MSYAMRRGRRWTRLAGRIVLLIALLGVTATLAAALQVRRVRIEGARRFPLADVERALQSAMGTPTLTARPEALREAVRTVPWVADARVRVSLDGVVSCSVTERTPAAVAVDGSLRTLIDASGRALGPAGEAAGLLTMTGFGAFPDERGAVLARIDELGAAWGAPVESVARLGPRDVAISFRGFSGRVIADPGRPAGVADARRVLAVWQASAGAPPVRLDARVEGRVALLPAPPTPPPDGAPAAAEAR